jgi:hypothetical protein
MPFIGAQPATTFAKATSQVFTNANGSIVDFTLNKHVSNPEDLEVFVSNVQQQPTTSYTILSDGFTLRFSEAPPSGDFYVVYRNFAQQTGIDTGALRKTGGTITGDVNVDSKLFNIDSSNDRIGINTNSIAENDAAKMTINADNTGAIIINNTGQTNGEFAPILFTSHATSAAYPKQGIGVKRTGDFGVGDLVFAVDSNADAADVSMTNDAKMTISQAGYITTPNQPSIAMDGNQSQFTTFTSDKVINEWTSFHTVGITYNSSNGRFTVPSDGKYLITVNIYLYQNDEFQRLQIAHNDTVFVHSTADYNSGAGDMGQDNSLTCTTIRHLSATDYITFVMLGGGTDRIFMGAAHSHCAIHKLS